MPAFDAEQIVLEAISQQTGVDPAEYSMRTKLRGGREIRPKELEAIVSNIELQLGKPIAPAVERLNTIGELIELVDDVGRRT